MRKRTNELQEMEKLLQPLQLQGMASRLLYNERINMRALMLITPHELYHVGVPFGDALKFCLVTRKESPSYEKISKIRLKLDVRNTLK